MTDPEKERWAARVIRERREQANAQSTSTPAPPVKTPDIAVRPKGLSDEKRAEIRREVEALKDRPVMRARRLAQYVAEGVTQGDIALALGVQQPWVSKRLALIQAPPEVLQQIEAGTLTENHYYNNRTEIELQLTGALSRPLRDRPIPLTITLETGRALAEILVELAKRHEAVPIRLDDKAGKKEIAEILNLRAPELRALMVKK